MGERLALGVELFLSKRFFFAIEQEEGTFQCPGQISEEGGGGRPTPALLSGTELARSDDPRLGPICTQGGRPKSTPDWNKPP